MMSVMPAVRENRSEPGPLGELVLAWLATKRSVHTRRAYASDLGEWLTWCDGRGADPLAATEALAAQWARRLASQGLASATAARRLSSVSSWYSWLVRGGHAPANPVAYLARPAVDRDVSGTPGLTRDQALALLAAGDQAPGPQRARTSALIAVLLLTGARISEITGADVEDLGVDRGHRVLWVTRKGG
ncbi:MAG: tyrosine-type recombinase/integrase, partial [Streptosporangiaceae bacterium]